ncbi:MAG: MoxR family ATPase [Candidatus Thorarchaeota archaeon]|nr:MoxR family ATPase [Candidatus Thorarchaeota archaeon]
MAKLAKREKKSEKASANLKEAEEDFAVLFERQMRAATKEKVQIVIKEQYREAFDVLEDCENAGLIPGIIGPPGIGKTLLLRAYAEKSERPFEWLTGDEGIRPSHLIGSYNPSLVLNKGFTLESFDPGPLLKSMVIGGVFGLNEANRLPEYVQNTLLEPFEERSANVQRLGRIKAHDDFFPVLTMNPEEMSGAHRLSEALRDRIRVWIRLGYPRKATEIEIVKMNCPEYKLTDKTLEDVYSLVSATRTSTDIEVPASIRAGISIARLASEMAIRGDEKDVSHGVISKAATYVLTGALRFRPGIDPEPAVNSLVRRALGVARSQE